MALGSSNGAQVSVGIPEEMTMLDGSLSAHGDQRSQTIGPRSRPEKYSVTLASTTPSCTPACKQPTFVERVQTPLAWLLGRLWCGSKSIRCAYGGPNTLVDDHVSPAWSEIQSDDLAYRRQVQVPYWRAASHRRPNPEQISQVLEVQRVANWGKVEKRQQSVRPWS